MSDQQFGAFVLACRLLLMFPSWESITYSSPYVIRMRISPAGLAENITLTDMPDDHIVTLVAGGTVSDFDRVVHRTVTLELSTSRPLEPTAVFVRDTLCEMGLAWSNASIARRISAGRRNNSPQG